LGKDNRLLWDLPEDMARFKQVTTGHPVIMGRRTFESIGRLLPKRTNIIISRDPDHHIKGAAVVDSLDKALKVARLDAFNPESETTETSDEVFVIGGAQVYEQALPCCDKLYLTVVDDEPEADVYFPDYSRFSRVLSRQDKEQNGLAFTFFELAPEDREN